MKAMMIPLAQIVESPFHHRTAWGDMDGLTQSIREHGVQQPVKVRPVEDHYEVIFGHRRFKAAQAAGLEEIPGLVEPMDDRAAALVQTIENGQREDVSELDEALDYQNLRDTHGMKVDEIAEQVGKSRAHVYNRLALTRLSEAAKKALAKGDLDATAAILVARQPTEDLQKRLLRDMAGRHGGFTYRELAEHVARFYTQNLSNAPFDTKDEGIAPDWNKVTCGKCPFRSGNMAKEERGDIKGDNVCTNPDCYAVKCEAGGKKALAEAKAAGKPVLAKKEAESIFNPGGTLIYSAPFVDLDREVTHEFLPLNGVAPKDIPSWRDLIGEHVTPTVAVDREGAPHNLVPKAEAKKALREHMPAKYAKLAEKAEAEREERASDPDKEKAKEVRAKRGVANVAIDMVLALDTVNDPASWPHEVWYALAHQAIEHEWGTVIAKRHGLEGAGEPLTKWMDKLGADELQALVLEAVLQKAVQYSYHQHLSGGEADLKRMLDGFGVTLADAKKELKERQAAAEEEKAAKKADAKADAKPKAKKKAKPESGARRTSLKEAAAAAR